MASEVISCDCCVCHSSLYLHCSMIDAPSQIRAYYFPGSTVFGPVRVPLLPSLSIFGQSSLGLIHSAEHFLQPGLFKHNLGSSNALPHCSSVCKGSSACE